MGRERDGTAHAGAGGGGGGAGGGRTLQRAPRARTFCHTALEKFFSDSEPAASSRSAASLAKADTPDAIAAAATRARSSVRRAGSRGGKRAALPDVSARA